MQLTGQCKDSFEKWFVEDHLKLEASKDHYYFITEDHFNSKHPSEKYGVYVDFFDSVDMHISMGNWRPHNDTCINHWFNISDPREGSLLTDNEAMDLIYAKYLSRPEARTEAIKKANEIYNKR